MRDNEAITKANETINLLREFGALEHLNEALLNSPVGATYRLILEGEEPPSEQLIALANKPVVQDQLKNLLNNVTLCDSTMKRILSASINPEALESVLVNHDVEYIKKGRYIK